VVAGLLSACDPSEGQNQDEPREGEEDFTPDDHAEHESEEGVARRLESSTDPLATDARGSRGPTSSPAPRGEPDELVLEVPTLESAPSCGLGRDALNAFSCNWERAVATSGVNAQLFCDANENVVSGGCVSSTSTHKLVSTYAVEASLDIVDDEELFFSGTGWNCQWDTAATMVNTHTVLILCCPSFAAAECI
jgi:hypothetical protein